MEPGKCQVGGPSLPWPGHDLDQVPAPLGLFPDLRKGELNQTLRMAESVFSRERAVSVAKAAS